MNFLQAILGNASEGSAEKAEAEFRPILVEGEVIETVLALIRDRLVFTNKRLLLIDKQGLVGRPVTWTSIPYHRISSFAAETTGVLDIDAQLKIWVGSRPDPVAIDISRGVSMADVYRLLSTHVLP